MKNFWKNTGWTLLCFLPVLISILVQLLLGVMLSVVFTIVGMIQLGAFDPTDAAMFQQLNEYVLEQAAKYSGAMIFGYHIIALLGFGLWYYFACGRPKITNPIKAFRGTALPTVIIFSFGLCLFANAFVLIAQYVAPNAMAAYMELMEAAGMGVDIFAILASVLLAPIGEEILCRGLTYYYAQKAVSRMNNRHVAFWIANSLQAIGFGIMHLNLIQGLYAFILGLGIGWLRERYKSLYPAMLAHFVVNFSSTFIMGYLLAPIPESFLSAVLLMVASITVCAIGVLLSRKGEV
ncbi:MAG: CPBP family intramembrane metalloprotease [Lachnospiraceae bacterium]|nr:CPBP family intramembrane metalloprotease [Lachnospiraceae bacterium]